MLTLQDIVYIHPNRDVLFSDLNFVVNKHDKIALIGNNGAGKSTLLKLLAGELQSAAGIVKTEVKPYYVPQLFGQYNHLTVAEALGVKDKLDALAQILQGNVTDEYMASLDDDWTVDERCLEALAYWKLSKIKLNQFLGELSGGQKTKVFLAGITLHQPQLVLLDEPSNHLDAPGRDLLYQYIQSTSSTLVVVSHDRFLLNLLNTVCELSTDGITVYGGNFDFYAEQKKIENDAMVHDVESKQKALRKAKETEREAMERQHKLDTRGKRKQEKAGMPTIMMNTMRNSAEKSTSRMKGVHAEKIDTIARELHQLRQNLPDIDKIKMGFDDSPLHKGKVLIAAKGVNFSYGEGMLWPHNLSFQITSGDRIAIKGPNGSGKTTLIKMILGNLDPITGTLERADVKSINIDQDYSLIDGTRTVYDQAQQFNTGILQEHDIKIRLNRFLFDHDYWDKPCKALSGGEKMRLMLCCLVIAERSPTIIVLDEPTNNLDLQNIAILTEAISQYKGTLLVVLHDEYFLKQVGVNTEIICSNNDN